MAADNGTEQIYIVISQTGTLLSRILRRITGAEYNHVSLGLTSDLTYMYSFGRIHPYNPIWGGFVTESPHFGTFKRFYNTKVIVLRLEVERDKYEGISAMIDNIRENRKKYHYNYFGIFFAAFKKIYRKEKCYYCSEFVKDVLVKNSIEGSELLAPIVQPIHFLNIPNTDMIYRGKLQDYSVFHKSLSLRKAH